MMPAVVTVMVVCAAKNVFFKALSRSRQNLHRHPRRLQRYGFVVVVMYMMPDGVAVAVLCDGQSASRSFGFSIRRFISQVELVCSQGEREIVGGLGLNRMCGLGEWSGWMDGWAWWWWPRQSDPDRAGPSMFGMACL